ncbi:MAG: competence/damage-inducible protein A [Gemmatimonadota bacterium]
MNVEIVTIGDELLLGLTIDTNGAWLARELGAAGVGVPRRSSVGDDAAAIIDEVAAALDRTGMVITTGGLGPTADDRTKPAIAAVFGREMAFHEGSWERLRALWRERGRPGEPPEANRQQVMIPAGAEILPNERGTAPGLLVRESGRWVAMLPGVPSEMKSMFTRELLPRLIGRAARVIRSATLRTTGIAESQLPSRLGDLASSVGGLNLAYLPGREGVDLRLTVHDKAPDEADRILAEGLDLLANRLGAVVYGSGSQDLAEALLTLCRERSLTIAVCESCTGGLLGARLTEIPGASDVFIGGAIAYDNRLKELLAGVRPETLSAHGAVSEQVALEMATGIRERVHSSIGVGITGVAGPTGGTKDKPVGLVWIAVDIDGSRRAFGPRLIGDRGEIRFRATQAALDLLRRLISRSGVPEWPAAGEPLQRPK